MQRAQSERPTDRPREATPSEREREKVHAVAAVCKRNVVEAAKTKSASGRFVVAVLVVI